MDTYTLTGPVVQQVLLKLYDKIIRYETEVVNHLDAESLHELRVTVRKTRSIITQMKGAFPEKAYQRFRDGFAWIGNITGTARDLDVYLDHFDHYPLLLPPSYQSDLAPLKTFLESKRGKAYRLLSDHLQSKTYWRLKEEWVVFLAKKWLSAVEVPHIAKQPAKYTVTQRVHIVLQQAEEERLALNTHSSLEDYHKLRKTMKKARYLIELFGDFYEGADSKQTLKTLKNQQQILGTLQDTYTQCQMLEENAADMMQKTKIKARTLCAIGMLIQQLYNKQSQLQQDVHQIFCVTIPPL